MDFDIEDEEARERVVKHVAERALAVYGSRKILALVSDAARSLRRDAAPARRSSQSESKLFPRRFA